MKLLDYFHPFDTTKEGKIYISLMISEIGMMILGLLGGGESIEMHNDKLVVDGFGLLLVTGIVYAVRKKIVDTLHSTLHTGGSEKR